MLSKELLGVLSEIRNLLDSPETDLTWSKWDSIDEALRDIDFSIGKVVQNDQSIIPCLKLLFAPTGSLQEVSINNGWELKYIDLSTRFDKLVGD